MNLFEISNEYLAILQLAEDPDVDPEVLADTMEGIEADFEDKADAYAYIISTLKGDAATADKVAALAQSRLQAKAEESASYSPEQYAVVQKAQLLRSGNYLALIVSPQVETLSQLFKSAAGI